MDAKQLKLYLLIEEYGGVFQDVHVYFDEAEAQGIFLEKAEGALGESFSKEAWEAYLNNTDEEGWYLIEKSVTVTYSVSESEGLQ